MKCKQCNKDYHYCTSCDIDMAMSNGFCCEEHMREHTEYKIKLEEYKKFISENLKAAKLIKEITEDGEFFTKIYNEAFDTFTNQETLTEEEYVALMNEDRIATVIVIYHTSGELFKQLKFVTLWLKPKDTDLKQYVHLTCTKENEQLLNKIINDKHKDIRTKAVEEKNTYADWCKEFLAKNQGPFII